MDEQIRQKIIAFNDLLELMGLVYKVDIVQPGNLKAADKNAHFMTGTMFQQLVENIKRDKSLGSVPLCWRDGQGVDHILSGHHRVDAAKAAGLEWVMILYIDRELTRQEQIAIQLSHNSIFGMDEPTTLRELWTELTRLDLKAYSGLDDQVMNSYAPVKIEALGEKSLMFQEVLLTFFPAEIERAQEIFEQLKKRNRKRWAVPLESFDRFIDLLLDFKAKTEIYNTATAFLAMLGIVEEWLAEHPEGIDIEESKHGETD